MIFDKYIINWYFRACSKKINQNIKFNSFNI